MLLTKTVKVKWRPKTKQWYENKGYTYTKIGDEFEVKVEDLSKGSNLLIKCLCDYCLEEGKETVITKQYVKYLRDNINSTIHKDSCKKCRYKKIKESNLLKYKTENVMQVEDFKENLKQSILNKYGVETYSSTKECKEKYKNTVKQKYGVNNVFQLNDVKEKSKKSCLKKYNNEYASQSEIVKNKIKNTNLNKYGCKNVFQNKEIKERSKQTSLKRWGVEYPIQNKEINKKAVLNTRKTLYINGTAPCSQQQKYIYNLIGGSLNYPVNNFSLDIAFPNEKIYVEYDGGGHNLQVKFKKITQKEFENKEKERRYILKSLGWKEIQIICKTDNLLNDKLIKELIEKGKNYLINSNHTFFKIDFDNMITWCKEYNFQNIK